MTLKVRDWLTLNHIHRNLGWLQAWLARSNDLDVVNHSGEAIAYEKSAKTLSTWPVVGSSVSCKCF